MLRSEARHFEDYLLLARSAAGFDCEERIGSLLDLDAELIDAGLQSEVHRNLNQKPWMEGLCSLADIEKAYVDLLYALSHQ